MTETSIINLLVVLMEEAENMVDLKNIYKKEYVLRSIQQLLGNDTYYKNYVIISELIEFIILTSKGKKLNINSRKSLFCC